MCQFYAKDFIETAEGLRFAVLKNGTEASKVLVFLRYAYLNQSWKKLTTPAANALLQEFYPQYLHYSTQLSAHLHAVEITAIYQHYSAKTQGKVLFQQPTSDPVMHDLQQLGQLFVQQGLDLTTIGITGSILIGLQNANSDIDLVFYQRHEFQAARQAVQELMHLNKLSSLSAIDWQESFVRRGCELNLTEYIWHEQRKFNKALINGRKFDLSLSEQGNSSAQQYQKLGFKQLLTQVIADEYSFDYPAIFKISDPIISTVVCFTATYTGQAQTGEWIQCAGQVEMDSQGQQRLIIGSSREAQGEYIKVVENV